MADRTQVVHRGRAGLRPYRILLGSRLRSQAAYRRSFVLDVLGAIGVGLVEFGEIYIIFSNIDALGGLDFAGVALLYALATLAFSLADLVVGHLDELPTYLRAGTLDAFLLRPLPVLAQLVTSDISLRRLGRTAVAVAVLAVALPLTRVHQRVHLRRQLRGVLPREHLRRPHAGVLHLRRARGIRRVPARTRPPRAARTGLAAAVAGLVHTARRGRGLECSPDRVADGASALQGSWIVIITVRELCREFTVRVPAGRLRRSRRTVRAVDGLTFDVTAGSAVGYIGANGAGKSTTIKMLTGILTQTSETVRTCGVEPVRRRKALARRIGVVFGQRSQLWWDLPLAHSFRTLAAIHRLPEATWRARRDELVDRLDLGGFLEPDGLRQRLAFAPEETTAAAVLAAVGEQVAVRDLTIDEPDIEDVVRRLYLSPRRRRSTTSNVVDRHRGPS